MQKVLISLTFIAASLSLAAQPYAYVANFHAAAGTVSVINTATNTVIGTISVGSYPTCIAFNPNGSRAYVTNFGLNTDYTTPGTVSVIDTTLTPPSVIATITVGVHPECLAVTPDGSKVYVGNFSAGGVSVISTATNTVTTSITMSGPHFVAITPDGSKAYVSDFSAGVVRVINTSTDTVIASPVVGSLVQGVAITPDGSHVYASIVSPSYAVSVIETTGNTVSAGPIPVGSYPIGIGISPDGSKAYVANFLGSSVSVIDTASNTAGTPITVGSGPVIPAVTPDGSKVFVGNQYASTVSVIDTTTHAVTTISDASFNGPFGITIQPGQTPQTPAQMVTALVNLLPTLGLANGQTSSLTDKLNSALASIQAGLNKQAINQLNAFISSVQSSQKTGKISDPTATTLINAARAIIALL